MFLERERGAYSKRGGGGRLLKRIFQGALIQGGAYLKKALPGGALIRGGRLFKGGGGGGGARLFKEIRYVYTQRNAVATTVVRNYWHNYEKRYCFGSHKQCKTLLKNNMVTLKII